MELLGVPVLTVFDKRNAKYTSVEFQQVLLW